MQFLFKLFLIISHNRGLGQQLPPKASCQRQISLWLRCASGAEPKAWLYPPFQGGVRPACRSQRF